MILRALRFLRSLAAPVPTPPSDVDQVRTLFAGIPASDPVRAANRLLEELDHERGRRLAIEAKAAEANRAAAKRNETIRNLEGELQKSRANVRQLEAYVAGHKGNAHSLSLKLADAIKRESALREELGPTRDALVGAKHLEEVLRGELDAAHEALAKGGQVYAIGVAPMAIVFDRPLEALEVVASSASAHRPEDHAIRARIEIELSHDLEGVGDKSSAKHGDGSVCVSLDCPLPEHTGLCPSFDSADEELQAWKKEANRVRGLIGRILERSIDRVHDARADRDEARDALQQSRALEGGVRKELEIAQYGARDLERTSGELRTKVADMEFALADARHSHQTAAADFLACAQAIGVTYEADHVGPFPGPVEDVVAHIRSALEGREECAERIRRLESLLGELADGNASESLAARVHAALEGRTDRPGDADEFRQLLGRVAQVLELDHPERATLGDLEDEIDLLQNQPAIAAAWVQDRAEQIDQSSADRAWADGLIGGLQDGEHLKAYRAGELDDLLEPKRKAHGRSLRRLLERRHDLDWIASPAPTTKGS